MITATDSASIKALDHLASKYVTEPDPTRDDLDSHQLKAVEYLAGLDALALDVDTLIRRGVTAARSADVDWSAIGAALGVSKQAAWARYRQVQK